MTTKPHPTDAMEMPEPDVYPFDSKRAHSIDQLRAERIKAYDLALEDAAKKCCDLAVERAAQNARTPDWFDCDAAIRSMKHEQH